MLSKGETRAGPHLPVAKALANRKKTGFCFFPGKGRNGSAWTTSLHNDPVLSEVIERCGLALRPHTDWSPDRGNSLAPMR